MLRLPHPLATHMQWEHAVVTIVPSIIESASINLRNGLVQNKGDERFYCVQCNGVSTHMHAFCFNSMVDKLVSYCSLHGRMSKERAKKTVVDATSIWHHQAPA